MFLTRPFTAGRSFARTHIGPTGNRKIFSPPPLPSFLQSQPEEPQTYHERRVFPYRPSQLYYVVSDVKSYPRFLPYCTNTRILSQPQSTAPGSNSANTMDVEMTVRFMAFEATYTSNVICTPNLSVEAVASSSSPIFKTLSIVWRFQSASPQSPRSNELTALSTPLQGARYPDSLLVEGAASDCGPTLVTLDLSFLFAHAAYAGASQMFFTQISKIMVSAFEQRCLKLYGPGDK